MKKGETTQHGALQRGSSSLLVGKEFKTDCI